MIENDEASYLCSTSFPHLSISVKKVGVIRISLIDCTSWDSSLQKLVQSIVQIPALWKYGNLNLKDLDSVDGLLIC